MTRIFSVEKKIGKSFTDASTVNIMTSLVKHDLGAFQKPGLKFTVVEEKV